MHTIGVVKESEILGLPPLSPLWTACVDSPQSLSGVTEFDTAFIIIVCFFVCFEEEEEEEECRPFFRSERTLVFTRAARAEDDANALVCVFILYMLLCLEYNKPDEYWWKSESLSRQWLEKDYKE